MIRILIADDHAIVRQGLRQIVALEDSMEVVAEAATGDKVLSTIRETAVDVIVLDISMPGRNGLETLKEVKRLYPHIGVVVLSMHPKDQYAVRVIRGGASSYLSKESAVDELVTAIKKASRGEKHITPDIADLFADYIIRGSDEPHKQLSDREFEVFKMIGMGKALTQISQELNLSVKTISTYRTRIIEKTGIANNAEMTRYLVARSLI
jgi:two-component system, NarL family, invasion response regulator UvrY